MRVEALPRDRRRVLSRYRRAAAASQCTKMVLKPMAPSRLSQSVQRDGRRRMRNSPSGRAGAAFPPPVRPAMLARHKRPFTPPLRRAFRDEHRHPVPLVFGDYALEDRYRLDKGRVYLTGIQALVRLPMMQRQRDLAAGLNTGGFISGYRGSPLGMYDHALWTAQALPQGKQHPLPARPQRGPRRHRGVGHASRSTCSPAPRSMACSASGTARGRASTARWTC